MIESFADKRAESIGQDTLPKRFFVQIAQAARRKLKILQAAHVLNDLRSPPDNRLEPLQGD